MPHTICPMLSCVEALPFDSPDWIFEIKWDGYRAIAELTKAQISLYSRNGLPLQDRYPPIISALQCFKRDAVLDGEIVVLDTHGVSQFELLQSYQKTHEGDPIYWVFDLLYLDGLDLRHLPLIQRKELLRGLIGKKQPHNVRYCDHVVGEGKGFFKAAQKQKLEGMMAKRSSSLYVSGRSREWLKIKTHLRQEMVICGFTEPQGGRRYFGSLALGIYENKVLVAAGNVGTGFTQDTLKEVHDRLIKLKTSACPFKAIPVGSRGTTWVKPQLICEVSFAQWTSDGQLRQASFKGLRSDKDPKDVVREDDNGSVFKGGTYTSG